MNKKTVLILALLTLSGCNSSVSKIKNTWGDAPAHITCYSGGKVIYDGVSVGKPFSEEKSDGYFFTDKATNDLMEVSGQCVIVYK